MENNEIIIPETEEVIGEEEAMDETKTPNIGGLALIVAGVATGVALLTKFVFIPVGKKVVGWFKERNQTKATDENGNEIPVDIQEASEKK